MMDEKGASAMTVVSRIITKRRLLYVDIYGDTLF